MRHNLEINVSNLMNLLIDLCRKANIKMYFHLQASKNVSIDLMCCSFSWTSCWLSSLPNFGVSWRALARFSTPALPFFSRSMSAFTTRRNLDKAERKCFLFDDATYFIDCTLKGKIEWNTKTYLRNFGKTKNYKWMFYLPFFFLGSLHLFGLQHKSLEVIDPQANPDQFQPEVKHKNIEMCKKYKVLHHFNKLAN